MQLPSDFSDFKNKNVLLFVAGKQQAKLYRLRDNAVEEIVSIEIPRPHYSDNEGVFQAAPGGRMVSGNVELRQDEVVITEFIHELEEKIKSIKADFEEIYYFAPSMSRTRIRESLPKAWQEKIAYEKEGNYVQEGPMAILEKLARDKEKPFEAISNEEKKILSIPQN